MNLHDIDPGSLQEEATIIAIMLIVISKLFPVLQDLALACTILVALGTLFLNRKKYWSEIKGTDLYKYTNNALKKTFRRTPKTGKKL